MSPYEMIAPAGSFHLWPEGMRAEMDANRDSGLVGSTLVSETEKVRVWHLIIPKGRRCAFHVHVLDYFWTCHSHGRAKNYNEDGSISLATYQPGTTMHATYTRGAYMLHAVENIGDTELLFTTVEYLQSANAPLPVPDGVRLKQSA